MGTNTTITTVKRRIVTVLTSALATANRDGGQLQVFYAWPGPQCPDEAVFLGPHPQTADIRLDLDNEIPTIKAGRKQSQETYPVVITSWQFRPDLSADGAETCEVRAEDVYDLIYDEFADDPRIGLGSSVIQRSEVTAVESTLFPFEAGWACEWRTTVTFHARLT